ncbi:class I SAM-dependent methyltransferase [Synoicihabitans lomoniglobus]|uniref:Class I SAM-dependent methyltransferase n=1 Tax=Synoicihabitans lomoniglobus TaxID=2909285 RepID=A0AAF0CT12_9BACT|nr:class I SAM-dependent methyltransferase [Opitutaceae bacterium LMO-M01]WED67401.1 class I SAM-dependent methyltransferase [Opitutaceae bacterium LMO-M01]
MPSRADYKNTWNELAQTPEEAFLYVGGTRDEAELDATAVHAINVLRATVGINPTDDFVEIGCGVGRVGKALSGIVKTWTGCDASGAMVSHANRRLESYANAKAIEVSGHDLQPLADASFDVVYSTVVFMHLDEWDRYRYVQEAMRILRPGGRFFCDNISITTENGWAYFQQHCESFKPLERPTHIAKCSTPQELTIYLERAGFTGVQTRERDLWVDAWGIKPAAS